jgi:hypothetical protein
MYQRVCREHRKICDLADDILRTVAQDRFTQAEVASKRLAFCRSLNAHSAAERNDLEAMAPGQCQRRPDLWRLHADALQRWQYSLADFNAQWPLSRLAHEPARFVREFGQLANMLRARFEWEEVHFLPQLLGQPVGSVKEVRALQPLF